MAVQVVKKELRCKLCAHERADDINVLLEKRSRREKDEFGNAVNLQYVLAKFAEWGVKNPTLDNVKGHLKNHIQLISETQAGRIAADEAEEEKDWMEAQQRILGDTDLRHGDVADRIAELELRVYEEFRRIQLSKGIAKPLTADQIRGMIAEKTKRKASDAQDELLKALGGGIGMVFEKALGGGSEPKRLRPPDRELDFGPDDPPIDAEVVSED